MRTFLGQEAPQLILGRDFLQRDDGPNADEEDAQRCREEEARGGARRRHLATRG